MMRIESQPLASRAPRLSRTALASRARRAPRASHAAVAATIAALALLAGCSDGGVNPAGGATLQAPEPSQIALQAVDAGTGGALSDEAFTVRHLARFPITLDATGVERVASAESFRVTHSISEDSLVLEVRLEAPSYHSLDTVLVVARGGAGTPVTLRMGRRLDRAGTGSMAAAPAREAEARPTPVVTPQARPTTTETRPAPTVAGTPPREAVRPPSGATPDPDAGLDRSAMIEGDRAFQSAQWARATNAYRNMPRPQSRTGTYARDYTQALVRKGESHIRMSEWAGALDALGEAVEFDAPGYTAYLLLTQAECAVGRVDQGRQTLRQVERIAPSLPAGGRADALALADYQRALCTQHLFDRSQDPREMLRSGQAALGELQTFIDRAEALISRTPAATRALTDARARQESIRTRLRTGG